MSCSVRSYINSVRQSANMYSVIYENRVIIWYQPLLLILCRIKQVLLCGNKVEITKTTATAEQVYARARACACDYEAEHVASGGDLGLVRTAIALYVETEHRPPARVNTLALAQIFIYSIHAYRLFRQQTWRRLKKISILLIIIVLFI